MKILQGTAIRDFERNGQIVIEVSPPIDLIDRIMRDFIRLTKEPASYRKKWLFHVSDSKRPDDGIIKRNGEKGKDVKFFFHYRPHLRALLASRGVNTVRYNRFLKNCDKLYEICSETVMQALKELDGGMFPDYGFVDRVRHREIMQRFFLRLLFYPFIMKEIMADDHPDRSLITLHVADSRPGLFLGDSDECYKARPDSQLLFASMRMEVITKGKIKAIQHYVRALDKKPRWSVVFFTHAEAGITEAKLTKLVDARTGILTKNLVKY